MTLQDYLNEYLEARELTGNYIGLMKISLRHFEEFLCRGATLDDLTSETINRFIDRLLERGLSRHTVHNYKQAIKRLWIDAYESHVVDRPPTRVRKIKGRREPTKAWTPDQVRRLLEVASALKGNFQRTRINRADFWRAFVLTAWDSGLRLGDLLLLRSDEVRGRDRFQLVQHKTGKPLLVKLRPETMAAIEKTLARPRERIFGGIIGRSKIYPNFKRLCDKAGIFAAGPGLGLTRMLRRSAATAVERATPGAAMRFLGHTSPGTAYVHYVDFTQLDDDRALVPSLLGIEQFAYQPPPDTKAPAVAGPAVADLQAMLEKLLADAKTRESQPASVEPAAGLPTLILLRDFLSLPELAKTSVSYRESLLSYVRQACEDCGFATTADLSGERLVAWLRQRQAEGLSASRVSWARAALVRFMKWLAAREGVGGGPLECLGHLSAADDLWTKSNRNHDGRRARKDGAA